VAVLDDKRSRLAGQRTPVSDDRLVIIVARSVVLTKRPVDDLRWCQPEAAERRA